MNDESIVVVDGTPSLQGKHSVSGTPSHDCVCHCVCVGTAAAITVETMVRL